MQEPRPRQGRDARAPAPPPARSPAPRARARGRPARYASICADRIAVLGEEMPAALAAQLELPGPGRVEQHHRLDPEAAVLGAAEAQHVDTRLPGQLRRRAAEMHQRVGETRPVHVHRQPVRPRHARPAPPPPPARRPPPPRWRWSATAPRCCTLCTPARAVKRQRPLQALRRDLARARRRAASAWRRRCRIPAPPHSSSSTCALRWQ